MVTQLARLATALGCWYEIWITECVLCGRTNEIRERRQPPKPENPYHYDQDACSHHFL